MSQIDPDKANYFCHLLTRVQSSDNDSRREAEEELVTLARGQPDELSIYLLYIIAFADLPQLRTYAALIFRRLFIIPSQDEDVNADPVRFSKLSPKTQEEVKSCLINSLRNEVDYTTRNQVCDVVSGLYIYFVTSEQRWIELPAFVTELCNEMKDPLRESGFKILASYPSILHDTKVNAIGKAFCDFMHKSEPSVLLSALRALVALIVQSERTRQDMLVSNLPQMIKVLEHFCVNKESSWLSESMDAFIDLAENKSDVLVKHFRPILNLCTNIMIDNSLEDSARHLSLEFILTIVDGSPSKCRKFAELPQQLIPVILEWMASFEDDEDWYSTTDLDDSDDDTYQMIAQFGLDRLACSLGGKDILPICFRYITPMLQSVNWQQRHAALSVISTIGEGCLKPMSKNIASIVELVLPPLQDPHPRVRYAALNTIGQLCNDFPEEFAIRYYQIILDPIMPLLEDDKFPRIQAHAAAALLNICEPLDKAMLEPYLEVLLQKLVLLLNGSKSYIQEQVITTIASIADSAEDLFTPYYRDVMPILVNIAQNAIQKEFQMLRAKAVESISLIILAVGYECVKSELNTFSQLLISVQESTNGDDTVLSYVQQAWTRLAIVFGKEFAPLLPVVIPDLISAAEQKPNVVVLDVEEDFEEKYPSDQGWEFRRSHGQQVGIRTSLMEDKFNAIEMLICYAQSLGSEFTYAGPLIPKLLSMFNFYFHPGVRHAAIRAVHHMLYCLVDAGEDRSVVDEIFDEIFNVQMRQLKIEAEQDYFNLVLKSFYEVVDVVGSQCLTGKKINKFTSVIGSKLEQVVTKLDEFSKFAMLPEYDEDDIDPGILTEIENNEEFIQTLSSAIHSIISLHGSAFFSELVPITSIANASLKNHNSHVRLWAVGVFDDVVEHGGRDATEFFQGCFCDSFIELLSDPSPSVRQAAFYGIGLWAKFGGPEYTQACNKAVMPLFNAIQEPSSRDSDNEAATDNAVSAIAKVLEYNYDNIDNADQVLMHWLKALPIKGDLDEVPDVYRYLLQLVENQHPLVLGSPEAVSQLVEILAKSIMLDIFDDGLKVQVIHHLKLIFQSTPDEIRSNLWSMVPENQRQHFASLLDS